MRSPRSTQPNDNYKVNFERILMRGVLPDFFVKFDLEIAIVQQTRACDRT